MLANMDHRTYLMEKDEAEYQYQLEQERIERERAAEEEACRLADLADQAEDAAWEAAGVCPYPYRPLAPPAEHECNDCGILIPAEREICTLCERWYDDRGLALPLPRIERRPVQLVKTAQGQLFNGEVA